MSTIRETLTLGLQKHQAGQLNDAEQIYKEILRTNPMYPDALHLYGVLQSQRGRDDLAVAYIERALIVKPGIAAFHNNLGYSLMMLDRYDEAERHFRETLHLQPDFAMAYNNLGKLHREQGEPAEALACYQRAVEMQSDNVEAHFNRGELWLLKGDFERGWREYEWRWQLPQVRGSTSQAQRWDGSRLDGKTIFLHAEQGLGDTIHFVRYCPMLKAMGGTVILYCQGVLQKLLASAEGIDSMVPWHTKLPAFDVREHLLNLPGVFHTTLESIPATIPYLHADPKLVDHWRGELRERFHLDAESRPKTLLIGIAWKGFHKNQGDRKRSIPLSCFAPLAQIKGVRLISLQKGAGSEQIQELADKFAVLDLGKSLDETSGAFMDTAAVMKNLDLVISCDTAIPHLAGALGVPAWVALTVAADWRWLLDRDDSPWYPTLRLFRQTHQGDWEGVFRRMAGEVEKMLQKRRHGDRTSSG